MRQAPNGKRPRNRPGRNNNRPQQSRNQTFDSSGPESKVRGTANQVYEKYLAMARDSQLSGDRVSAENFFQHAEHYFRIMVASGQLRPQPTDGQGDEGDDSTTVSEGEREPQSGSPQPPANQPQAAPVQAAPVQAAPVQAAPVQAAPVKTAPVKAAPVKASPARPETPAELAQAAAANGADQPAPRPRGRRPRRPEAPAEA
jgi:hypothetical protein